jgi:hypothetical protein
LLLQALHCTNFLYVQNSQMEKHWP